MVHLEADMTAVIAWANLNKRRWVFSLSNAGARYTKFRREIAKLEEVNWPAVASNDFRTADIKEGKQAEFLVHHSFPWHLVSRIGVHSITVGRQAMAAIATAPYRPTVEVMPDWYF